MKPCLGGLEWQEARPEQAGRVEWAVSPYRHWAFAEREIDRYHIGWKKAWEQ